MNRNDVTEKIITAKVAKGLKWESVAKKVGLSKEWVTAGCLGQMTFDEKQAKVVGKIFGLSAEEIKWLQVVPYKGSLPTAVPTDPLIYRWYRAPTRPQGRPRQRGAVRQVSAVQAVLRFAPGPAGHTTPAMRPMSRASFAVRYQSLL